MYKKLALVSALITGFSVSLYAATAPCGSSGILNVGILDDHNPYSDFDDTTGIPYGFDVDLVCAIAKLLGYSINFVFVPDAAFAGAGILAGSIDIFANSATDLNGTTLGFFGAVVTDISHITNAAEPQDLVTSPLRGYLFNRQCCSLMYQFEAALTALVENGTYAEILQKQRQDPGQAGDTDGMGQFAFSLISGNKLVEPLPFHSSMAGTIPQGIASGPTGVTGCLNAKVGVPQTNCFTEFVLSTLPCTFTFTGPDEEEV